MKKINNTRIPMYIKSMAVLAFLVLIGCNNENTSLTNSNSPPDSIISFAILKDTTIIDANLSLKDFPRTTKISDSVIQVECLVTIDCGDATFGVSKNRDTLIVSAIIPKSYICNDWSPLFYYKATIQYVGKLEYLKLAGNSFKNGYGDTLVRQ
jgi:hypothetical protein